MTPADAATLTTPACLAKKLKEWGKLRQCQATENGKALQGKDADPGKCQVKFDDRLATLDAKATKAAIACRYRVNGDGTATDYDAGLQWEQKTDDGSVHDKDNRYTWITDFSGTTPNGTVFTEFLGTLNSCVDNGTFPPTSVTGGFAGHCDWRLPSIVELQTIVDLSAPGCGAGSPCIAPAFGPREASRYWSATNSSDDPGSAWYVDFFGGLVGFDSKRFIHDVRGVRSGL